MRSKHYVWRWVRLSAGSALLVLGVIGLVLPVLPGIVFIASGLALLGTETLWARRLMARISAFRSGRSTPPHPPDPTPPNRSNFPPNAPF
ncbi:MAG: hypothetical protein DMH00_02275 [Acidobacteria bacterium]|nr:MAG: hypothetical protein DMH00_02275 [Acidobacteriota bacterium]